MTSAKPKTTRGAARRLAILRSAEKVIGEKGFASASIADITRDSGTAMGTFYIYFPSKEQIFRDLLEEMGLATRKMMAEAVAGAPNRIEAEKRGLRAFLAFVMARPSLYRIVEEARFVDPEGYRAYFTRFAEAYRLQLERAAEKGEISPGDAEVRAWALMGIAKTLGDRFVLWSEQPDLDQVTEAAHALIVDGLKP